MVLLVTKPISARMRAVKERPTVTIAMVSWLSLDMGLLLGVPSLV